MLRRQRNKVVGEKKGKESEVGDVSVKQMEKEKENKMVSGGRRKGKRDTKRIQAISPWRILFGKREKR